MDMRPVPMDAAGLLPMPEPMAVIRRRSVGWIMPRNPAAVVCWPSEPSMDMQTGSDGRRGSVANAGVNGRQSGGGALWDV
jgi:hypothetical protein